MSGTLTHTAVHQYIASRKVGHQTKSSVVHPSLKVRGSGSMSSSTSASGRFNEDVYASKMMRYVEVTLGTVTSVLMGSYVA